MVWKMDFCLRNQVCFHWFPLYIMYMCPCRMKFSYAMHSWRVLMSLRTMDWHNKTSMVSSTFPVDNYRVVNKRGSDRYLKPFYTWVVPAQFECLLCFFMKYHKIPPSEPLSKYCWLYKIPKSRDTCFFIFFISIPV